MLSLEPSARTMTAQQHADHLLAVWQQRRDLPPEKRLPPVMAPIAASRPLNRKSEQVPA